MNLKRGRYYADHRGSQRADTYEELEKKIGEYPGKNIIQDTKDIGWIVVYWNETVLENGFFVTTYDTPIDRMILEMEKCIDGNSFKGLKGVKREFYKKSFDTPWYIVELMRGEVQYWIEDKEDEERLMGELFTDLYDIMEPLDKVRVADRLRYNLENGEG